ncbi:MAG TPA: T9SS type A sorting domain-containing protein [Bacteroidales bacterium]|mgnify:CR=1 FL=1|nr:T9SS type A sorting domain-containing protein [Bacteroidales bacterium]
MKTVSKTIISFLAIVGLTVISYISLYSQCIEWDWASNSDTPLYHNSGWDMAKDIAVDANNNLIVAGDFRSGELYFGSTILSCQFGHYDIFVAKYDEDGNVLWAISGNGDSEDNVNAVAVDINGDVYITGQFRSPVLSFGSSTLNNSNSGAYTNDVFVVKLNGNNGNVLWAISANGDGDDFALDIDIDNTGSPIITGYFQQADDITFGSLTLTKPCHNWGMYMVKFTSTGNVDWGLCAEEANWGGCKGYSLTTDNQDNILVVGTYQFEPVTFGSTTLTYDINQGEQIFLAKYDSNGNTLWAKKSSGVNNYGGMAHVPRSIAADNQGNVFITGYFDTDVIQFGNQSLNSSTAPAADIFLVKYNTSGTAQWLKGATSSSICNNYGRSVSTDNQGNIFLTGHFNSSALTFDNSVYAYNSSNQGNSSDYFIAKYNTEGNIQWAETYGAEGNEETYCITVNKKNDLYFSGSFTSTGLQLNDVAVTKIVGQPDDYDLLLGKIGNSIKPVFTVSDVLCFGGNDGSINLSVSGGTSPYTYEWSNNQQTQNINSLIAGTYIVTISDNSVCEKIDSATIYQPEELIGSINDITNVTCFNGNDGIININVTGGTPPYSFLWSNNAETQNIYNLTAGTYALTITDNNNCETSLQATVNQPEDIIITQQNITNVSCFGYSDGTINIQIDGGTPPYSCLWSNSYTGTSISNLTAGNYTVSITDSHNCQKVETIAVEEPELLTANIVVNDVLCYGGNDGSIELTPQGGTAPYSYQWSNGATSQNAESLNIGNYSVTIIDNNGCTITYSEQVFQPEELTGEILETIDASCYGYNDGSITINVSGGVTPYSFNWSDGSTEQNLNDAVAGDYSITITDSHNCTFQLQETINQPDEIILSSLNVTNVSCFGYIDGSIDIEIAGGTQPYECLWSNSETSTSISNLISGLYELTITDSENCIKIESIIVAQPEELQSSIIKNDVQCFGESNGVIDLIVEGGTEPYEYLWSNGETTEDISNLEIGTYQVTISDFHGCETTNSVEITEPDELIISIDNITNVSCFGFNNGSATVNVTGGTPPYYYEWSNGINSQNITELVAGNYSLTVTDAHNCIAEISCEITEPSEIVIDYSIEDVLCFGESNGAIDISPVGGVTPYTYLWSNGAISEDIDNLTAGSYIVTITDFYDCVYTWEFTVNQPDTLSLDFSNNNICFGETSGEIDLTVSGGTLPYSYQWSNGAITEDITDLSAETYYVTVIDGNNCSIIDSSEIIEAASPFTTNIYVQDVLCNGDNTGSISVDVSGSIAPYQFLWSNGETTANISELISNTYSLTITDDIGCTTTESIIVNEPDALETNYEYENPNCYGSNTGSIDLEVSGGVIPYDFFWSNGETSEDIEDLNEGVYSVFVLDHNNCVVYTTAELISPLELSANFEITNTCYNSNTGTINIEVAGGTPPYSYVWNNENQTQQISNLTAGTYYVTITDFNGCELLSSATVEETNSAIEIDADISNILCYGENTGSIETSITGGANPYSCIWSNGQTTQNIYNLEAGNYSLTVSDNYGCQTEASYTLNETTPILISFEAIIDSAGNCTGELTANVTGGTPPYEYQWYDTQMQTTQTADSLCGGYYLLNVYDSNYCNSSNIGYVETGSLSIENNQLNNLNISIFPNPAHDYLYIDISETEINISTLKILNITGQVLIERYCNSDLISIDLNKTMNEGIYLLQLFNEDSKLIETVKIMIE